MIYKIKIDYPTQKPLNFNKFYREKYLIKRN